MRKLGLTLARRRISARARSIAIALAIRRARVSGFLASAIASACSRWCVYDKAFHAARGARVLGERAGELLGRRDHTRLGVELHDDVHDVPHREPPRPSRFDLRTGRYARPPYTDTVDRQVCPFTVTPHRRPRLAERRLHVEGDLDEETARTFAPQLRLNRFIAPIPNGCRAAPQGSTSRPAIHDAAIRPVCTARHTPARTRSPVTRTRYRAPSPPSPSTKRIGDERVADSTPPRRPARGRGNGARFERFKSCPAFTSSPAAARARRRRAGTARRRRDRRARNAAA